jgi:hypothetical protein
MLLENQAPIPGRRSGKRIPCGNITTCAKRVLLEEPPGATVSEVLTLVELAVY